MHTRITYLLICGILSASVMELQAEESMHPYPLFPSKVPGRPGLGAPEIWPHYQAWEKARKAGDNEKAREIIKPFFSEHFLWGHPEFLPYPGSVEHVRIRWQRYVPAYPIYNHNTLIKNVILRDHQPTAKACVPFEEPVYWTSQWNVRVPTSLTRDVGKVYPWQPGKSIELTVGPLQSGLMYAVRAIGAMKSEDVVRFATVLGNEAKEVPAKQFVFRFEINDQPDGSVSTYYLRGRAWDNFHETVSCLWHVMDDRKFHIKIALERESEAVLYTHNVDVHNIFGECAMRAGKTKSLVEQVQPTLWKDNRAKLPEMDSKTYGGLRMLAADYHSHLRKAERGVMSDPTSLLASVNEPPLSAEKRTKRDDDIWHSLPPLNHSTGPRDSGKVEAAGAGWSSPDRREWYQPWRLIKREIPGREGRDSKIVATYTWNDMKAYKKLPGTECRGYGIKFDKTDLPEEVNYQILSCLGLKHFERWQDQGRVIDNLTKIYHELGDHHAARDAAMLLARMAYHYPALRGVNHITWAETKDPTWQGVDSRGGRYGPAGWGAMDLIKLARCYDQLFTFINGNEEFARALGQHVPWVKASDDVRFLFDVYLLQYTVRDSTHSLRVYSEAMISETIRLINYQGDPEITRPWMEHIFTRTWEYPNAMAGLDDYVVTTINRDGLSHIGSYCYTGASGLKRDSATAQYVANGGDPKYDLGDFTRFPKSLTGVYFAFEGRVGGGFYPGIGDVGGPARGINYYAQKIKEYASPGWALTREPQFAWYLVNVIGRETQTDAEWAELEAAAAKVPESPLLSQRSRVLSDWFGVLEGGAGDPDFRFHRAVAVNVGNGVGHSHDDTMDLRIWALGANMSGDFGQRQSYGRPRHACTFSHNLVEVDGDGAYWTHNTGRWDGYAWVRTLFDAPGAPYMMVESTPPPNHRNVKLFRRQVALVDVDEGRPSQAAEPAKASDVTLPASYVFDVFRVSGGRRHTYCFHGCVDDNLLAEGGFEVNVKNRVLIDEVDDEKIASGEATSEELYLRNFRWARVCEELSGFKPGDIDKQWAADPADDTLRATWRMGEQAYRYLLGQKDGGAVAGGRKYMRMHLFNVGDHRVLHGINTDVNGNNPLNPGIKHYSGRCLYVQKTAEKDLESAYAAILEPYDGRPVITESRQLVIEGNEEDAKRAVAVQVKTRYGTEDLLFADARPEELRSLPGSATIAGEYACVSRDKDGLRRVTLTGGTQLTTPELDMRVSKAAYTGNIVSVDLLERTVEVEGLPALDQLTGSFFEIGNELHKTSFEIDRISRAKNGNTILHCRKGLEIMRATVLKVNSETNQIVSNVAMGYFPGRNDGLIATNGEDLSKRWRVRYEGGTRFDGHTFTLKGAPITSEDVSVGSKLSVWEFGAGDTVSLKTGISLARQPDGRWKVTANAPAQISMAGKKLEWSPNGNIWKPVTSVIGPGCDEAPKTPTVFFIREYLRSQD